MTVLPIVARELAVASRRPGTYWLRFWAAAGALALFTIPCLTSDETVTQMGAGLFVFLTSVTLGLCLLSGVFLTADSLSVEKREGTLGLLFLTDLRGYDVVLGKLAASSLHAFFGLLAVFPVLALPLLSGGLSVGEFWRTMLVFLVTLYFSLAVGMLVSAASREGRQAMAITFGVTALLAGLLPGLLQLFSFLHSIYPFEFLLWPSPIFAYTRGFDTSYASRFGASDYWNAVMTISVIASACIIASILILPRVWQKSSDPGPGPKPSRTGLFSKKARSKRGPPREQNPFRWLAGGDSTTPFAGMRILAVPGLLWALALAACLADNLQPYFTFAFFLLFILHFTLKVIMAMESGRRFYQDRQSGAMELLLVTPLPADTIIAGQNQALSRQFRPAVVALTLASLFTMITYFIFDSRQAYHDSEGAEIVIEFFLGGTLVLWTDASALSWVGMWRGLNARKFPRSVLATWACVILPPWGVVFLFVCLANGAGADWGTNVPEFLFPVWFVLSAGGDLAWTKWAQTNLANSFRKTISER